MLPNKELRSELTQYLRTGTENVKDLLLWWRFSKGRLVLSHICNQLTVASTRALMCLGAWSKLSFVRDTDLLAAAALPDVMEDEDELNEGWDYITYS